LDHPKSQGVDLHAHGVLQKVASLLELPGNKNQKLKTSTNIPLPGVEGVVEINKGKTIGRKHDKGKKKIWQV
jgi:hypothetical protein